MKSIVQIEVPENPCYYGILPANVRYNKNISSSSKILYTELTALSNKEGYCWASNSYFAKLYDVDDKTVSKWISELSAEGLIHIKVEKSYRRTIFTTPFRKKLTPLPQKADTPLPQKADNNITSINSKLNNKNNIGFLKKLSTISNNCTKCNNSGLVTMLKDNIEYAVACNCEKGKLYSSKRGYKEYNLALKEGYKLNN